ncbi:biopolymer transporter ExbD [Botrimarina sp.]|uniref:ExbD/TolR family protein n=1 Tax=Botrimarina sp. TaxID=2795802 RepID=UPI0032ED1664
MPLKRTTDDAPPLNLTPMIDVVFLLVIFFMTATQFAEVERAVEMQLPEVSEGGTTVAAANEPRVVSVMADGALTLDGQACTLEELSSRLDAARRAASGADGPEVLIHGDARCDFQHIAAALAACREARVAEVGVSVDAAPAVRR